ncbi:MAG: hypothetical protein ABSB91_07420, partial [Sedimentisphaerales bacterium]
MAKNKTKITLALVVLLAGLLVVSAQAAQQPAAAPAGTSQVAAQPAAAAPEIGTFHNPTDWLEMGADVRFREHYGYNWTALNSN